MAIDCRKKLFQVFEKCKIIQFTVGGLAPLRTTPQPSSCTLCPLRFLWCMKPLNVNKLVVEWWLAKRRAILTVNHWQWLSINSSNPVISYSMVCMTVSRRYGSASPRQLTWCGRGPFCLVLLSWLQHCDMPCLARPVSCMERERETRGGHVGYCRCTSEQCVLFLCSLRQIRQMSTEQQ